MVFVAALCVSAITFYRDAPELPRSARAPTSAATAPITSTATAQAPTPSQSAPTPLQLPRTSGANQGKPPKGPGTTKPGILLMASPLPHGDFDVAEMVLLSTPTSSLWLAPPDLTLAGSRFDKSKPVASEVQMSAGDQPVVVPGGRIRERTEVTFSEPVKQIELRYNLSGTTIRSMPAPAGRALAAISPLTDVPNNLPVAVMISGSTVHNIQCPIRRVREQACWIGEPPHLRVKGTLRGRGAEVLVQFDLPKPQ